MADPLAKYKSKRNFAITSEPAEGGTPNEKARAFVIQKHWATRLHYDFRIELEGAMKSWAVPKGPSYDPKDKRMAVHVEDHPISYNTFEGTIPEKQYGAGKVIIWDKGTWAPVGDPHKGYADGNLKFELHGHKMRGHWALIKIKSRDGKDNAWLLIKEHDQYVKPATEFSVVDEFPDSVAALPMPEGAAASKAVKKTAAKRVAKLPKAELPAKLAPVLATLVDGPPSNPEDWIFEIKFDGYRMLTRIGEDGSVRIFTRNGNDWTSKLKSLASDIEKMKLKPGWLDGEAVILNDQGTPDFQPLQNAFDNSRTKDIVYFIFDVPFYDGYDLKEQPLIQRRALLEGILQDAPDSIRFSATFEAPAKDIVLSACKMGLEGVIGKKKDSLYTSRRSPEWIKLKCTKRQEFVIGGWTDPKGSRVGMGSILVGVHNSAGELVYAGSVGSGFNGKSLADVLGKLQALSTDKRPFKDPTENDKRAHWVKPTMLAEVTFAEWTKDNHIRHPVFHALRSDKPAKNIIREVPQHPEQFKPEESASTLPAKFKVSNPERVIDKSTGITKVELVRFYGLVAPLMMEHLKGRPVSLVRAPTGIEGELYFQKHLDKGKMEGIRLLDPAIHPGHEQYMEVATTQGLLSAAQMNVVEFHTWNGVKTAIGKPDRMTFDLDPGQGVDWPAIQQATALVHTFLTQLGLKSFVKTSGGKGLHVVVPLKKQHDWDTVKDFSQAIVVHMARTLPQIFVAKLGPKNRIGKIFIDYLRNGFGATTACAWSARSRPGLGVSVPIGWDELSHITGGAHWHLRNIHTRLDKGNDPWTDYPKSANSIGSAMKLLGFKKS